jgi:hypothetical protein
VRAGADEVSVSVRVVCVRQVSKAQPRLAQVDPASLLLVAGLWVLLHCCFLVVNAAAARMLRLGGGRGHGAVRSPHTYNASKTL